MARSENVGRWQGIVLWAMIGVYVLGRICQQFPGPVPVLLIVILQVAPPAVFAFVHGSIVYRIRGMVAFTVFCAGTGTICESLSLRTGFPFGHYFFTGLMGPKIFDLPVLLVRGERSNILAPDAAERFRDALPQGRLVTVPNCGHNVHGQNTLGFIAALAEFLQSLPDRRSPPYTNRPEE